MELKLKDVVGKIVSIQLNNRGTSQSLIVSGTLEEKTGVYTVTPPGIPVSIMFTDADVKYLYDQFDILAIILN